jgi:signal transduction histidine kinase
MERSQGDRSVHELTPELRALYELTRAASSGAESVEELLDRTCTTIVDATGFERATIFLLDEDSSLLTPLAAHGIPLEEVPRGLHVEDQPLFERALELGEAVFAVDVRDDEALTSDLVDEFGLSSAVVVPLVCDGRSLGFLAADRGGSPFELEQSTLDVLTTMGALAGVFLERMLETSELRRLNELAQSFVALASHELRTPAAVVHGIAATLHARGDRLTGAQLADLRRTLFEQTDRLRRLLDQVLDLSRLEARAFRIRPAVLRVRRRVEELVVMLAGEHAEDVDVVIQPDLEVEADPEAFDRVVANLITNALRYGRPPVRVSAGRSKLHFRLAVEDAGDGVAPEFVPRLFERFARSGESKDRPAGSGLGLSIAQSYARAHGGDIVYSDASPHGARFELVLPAQA